MHRSTSEQTSDTEHASTHLFGGGIDSRWALLPLELLIGELASFVVFLKLLLPGSDSLCHLLAVCLVRLVLGP